MKQTDGCLQHAKEAGAAERPAILQQNVVLLLDADSRELAQHIEPVREVLKLDELDLPVALLFRNDGLQGYGGIAMSPAAVVENDVHSFHWPEKSARRLDRKSTRLNSSHGYISYAVFCLKKKKKKCQ